MRVIFTDIKQKGNCWNGSGPRSVATQAMPFVSPIFYNLAWPAGGNSSYSPEAAANITDAYI